MKPNFVSGEEVEIDLTKTGKQDVYPDVILNSASLGYYD